MTKKSETNITVLIDADIKKAFADYCKDEDKTVSQAIRAFIKSELEKKAKQLNISYGK